MAKKLSVALLIDAECYFEKDPQLLGLTKESKRTMEYAIAMGLRNNNCDVYVVSVGNNIFHTLGILKDRQPDLIFNYVQQFNGSRQAEVNIPAVLDLCGFKYTGPCSIGSMLSIDKKLSKDIMQHYGIQVPHSVSITTKAKYKTLLWKFPVIIKPNFEGGSTGIFNYSVARTSRQVPAVIEQLKKQQHHSVLVESFIAGKEITVAVIGNGESLLVYPPREIVFSNPKNGWSILTSDIKSSIKIRQKSVRSRKFKASQELHNQIIEIAQKTFKVLKMRDYARIDLRITAEQEIFVVDTNCNPGLNPHSWVKVFGQVNFNSVIRQIVEAALTRYSSKRSN